MIEGATIEVRNKRLYFEMDLENLCNEVGGIQVGVEREFPEFAPGEAAAVIRIVLSWPEEEAA